MSESNLKDQITEAMKNAMRAKEKERLGTIRLILADIKRIEVDERIELDDARVLQILDKMVKQRRDSSKQFKDADRMDLAEQEDFEIGVIEEFLPAALSEAEISEIIDAAVSETGASTMQQMGQVIGKVRPQVQGRADMGQVSQMVKAKLS
ncbi:MAG: GatB/YqeY domain-containing protein [Porticoccaceae bacterium]|jgi:uncharacterized protein|nr:GatB/YqeY domain-containing protein [Porticoccaceae bacterium]